MVTALGGMAQKQQLVARGARDLDLTSAVRGGDVSRARQGWYTTLPPTDARVRAVRVGGRLTGISAVIQAGGWVLGAHPLHVSVPENAGRLRSQRNRRVRFDMSERDGVVLHWEGPRVVERGSATSAHLEDALYRVILDEDLETAVAALDWALRTNGLGRIAFEQLMLRLPADCRVIRDWVDPACDSLPESLARTRLRLRGHSVESQVRVGDLERIDLVVDECVGVEADGEEFHLTRFEHDRRKDASILVAGLFPVRPSARMIFFGWERVVLAIERAISMHVATPVFGNSGQRRRDVERALRKTRWRGSWQQRSPEFPAAPGNRRAEGALQIA